MVDISCDESTSSNEDLKELINEDGSFIFMTSETISQLVDMGVKEKMESLNLEHKMI